MLCCSENQSLQPIPRLITLVWVKNVAQERKEAFCYPLEEYASVAASYLEVWASTMHISDVQQLVVAVA